MHKEHLNSKDKCTPMFLAALFTIASMEATQMSINRGMDKKDAIYIYIHTHTHTHTSLEKEMATHSSIPAWKIPWTEEPGGLQSMGS